MVKTVFALTLALTLTVTWIGRSAAQSSAHGHLLRVLTTTVSPEKRDQLPQIVAQIRQLLADTKGIQWFRVGTDPATGEIASVTLWNNQADIDAFMNSDARKAFNEKIRPLMQGEPTIKQYQVSAAKQ
jgi:quinol monooxygenase YgiN